jgi:hypothetical protein
MDAIDTFKIKALENMRTTIDSLTSEVQKAQSYLARAESSASREAESGELVLPAL